MGLYPCPIKFPYRFYKVGLNQQSYFAIRLPYFNKVDSISLALIFIMLYNSKLNIIIVKCFCNGHTHV